MSISTVKIKDRLIWSFLVLVWLSALWSLNHFSSIGSLVSVGFGILLLAITSALLSKTQKMGEFFAKLMSIKLEAAKVSWSSWENTRKTALMVSVLVAVFAVLMWMVDAFFTLLIKNML